MIYINWENKKGDYYMNKIVKNLAVLIVAGMLLTLSACDLTDLAKETNANNATSSGTQPDSTSSNVHTGGPVNADQAKAIVLQHAGFSEADVQFKKVELESDNAVQKYDIEFYANGKEYDYNINVSDGTIIKFDNEFDHGNNTANNNDTAPPANNTNPQANNNQANANASQEVTLNQAKDIALKHAGVNASQARFTKTAIKWDDGRKEYDIEFYVGNNEYDYEIDALTGKITEYDNELGSGNNNSNNNAQYISVDKAKDIALKHAGVSAANARFVKSKLDSENGRKIYEVEFYVGRSEYEYDIDAITGQILSHKVDLD